jgi:hypothetical protein
MKPIQGVQYSAIVVWDGFSFRNDRTKAIEHPIYLQVRNYYGAKRHAHEDAFQKAMKS